jgi:hypothetical protein
MQDGTTSNLTHPSSTDSTDSQFQTRIPNPKVLARSVKLP